MVFPGNQDPFHQRRRPVPPSMCRTSPQRPPAPCPHPGWTPLTSRAAPWSLPQAGHQQRSASSSPPRQFQFPLKARDPGSPPRRLQPANPHRPSRRGACALSALRAVPRRRPSASGQPEALSLHFRHCESHSSSSNTHACGFFFPL